jgi:uncharacterized protein (UPF0333 family)
MEDSFISLKVALGGYKIVEKKLKGEKMGFKIRERGQGATEYLLMLAAVLVIVAVAIYYVTRAGGYPAISMNATSPDNHVHISVLSGSIASGQWAFYVGTTPSGTTGWTTANVALSAPSVDLTANGAQAYAVGTTVYVNIKHISTGHIYFASDQVVTVGSS